MGLISNIRNFFYAATHANELIADNQRMRQELAQNSSIIEMQTNEIQSISEANNAITTRSDFWKRNYKRNLSEGFSPEQAKSTYQSICLTVDPEGTLLFTEAQKMWGDFNYEFRSSFWIRRASFDSFARIWVAPGGTLAEARPG